MNIKGLFALFMGMMPVLVGLWFGLSIAFAPSPDVAGEKVGEAVTYFAIPGSIKAIQFVAGIPLIGGVLVVGIVIYAVLRRNGSI